MACLVDATETEFETDFAILSASQDGEFNDSAGSFASSIVGSLFAHWCTKYARAKVRAERWSSRPEPHGIWEDTDELPFAAIEGGGPVRVSGFDPPIDDNALDLDGFGTGRVQVLARGRHRYDYSDDAEGLPPEEWLLRFFPEAGTPNPLAGPPRRLLSYVPFRTLDRPSGWRAALRSWDQSGWHSHLSSSPGFYAVRLGLGVSMQPLGARALANASSRFTLGRSPSPLPFPDDPREIELGQPHDDPLAALHGSPIQNLGDAIDAMRALQLLLDVRRADGMVLVPNPAPGYLWDVAPLSEKQVQALRIQIGYAEFREIAEDIAIAVEWTGDAGLLTTVEEMGIRWSTSSADIRGGLDLASRTSRITVSPPVDEVDAADDGSPILLRLDRHDNS